MEVSETFTQLSVTWDSVLMFISLVAWHTERVNQKLYDLGGLACRVTLFEHVLIGSL